MRWIDRSLPFNSVAFLSFSAPLFHSPCLSVCLSFTGNESFSLCSVAGDLPLLLALLPGTFWGQFESRRESDTQQDSNRARGRGSSGNGGKCARNADQGEGDQGTGFMGEQSRSTCRQPVCHRHRHRHRHRVSEHVVCANL